VEHLINLFFGLKIKTMKISNIVILFTIYFLFNSCIDEYSPELKIYDTNKIVVNGGVTDIEGFHKVTITRPSDLNTRAIVPVTNCDVKILDINENIFQLYEYNPGNYQVYIEQQFLTEGNAFKIEILTPEGDIITSEFDTLQPGSSGK